MNSINKNVFNKKNAVFFIAEIGGNHEGDFEQAKRLTNLALESGADAIKFQFYTGDSLVCKQESPERNAHFKKFELSDEENLFLIQMVKEGGAIPMASVWSLDMLKWTNPHLPYHKVGSGDLTCYPILAALVKTKKPIILSTGLSSLSEVTGAVEYIKKCDLSYITDKKLALLQCTSSYPTPDEDVNLAVMQTLKNKFGLPVGYSDHTIGSNAIEAAVAMGAEIIEKHFTDTREGKTFRDHMIALTSEEVKKSLSTISRISLFTGSDEKKLSKSEREAKHHISFRRGIYLSRDIKEGEKICAQDLKYLRPMHGICASKYEEVIGKIVNRDILAGQPLAISDIGN